MLKSELCCQQSSSDDWVNVQRWLMTLEPPGTLSIIAAITFKRHKDFIKKVLKLRKDGALMIYVRAPSHSPG
jgi:hypothetical protein